MNNGLNSRNVTIDGHRTSMRLEPAVWEALREICDQEGLTNHELIAAIDFRRKNISRTTAVRAFVVAYFYTLTTGKDRLWKDTVLPVLTPLSDSR